MKSWQHRRMSLVAAFLVLSTLGVMRGVKAEDNASAPLIPDGAIFPNLAGASRTYGSTGGGIDLTARFSKVSARMAVRAAPVIARRRDVDFCPVSRI